MTAASVLVGMARAGRICATLLVLAAALGASMAFAQTSIKVLVNDDPITTYDIRNRTTMLRAFTRGQQGEKDAIEQLIDERLMMQEAARRNVQISDEELDQEFARRANQTGMSAAEFSQAMQQSGIDPATFKDFLRANLAWREIIRARFRATVDVTEQDVTA